MVFRLPIKKDHLAVVPTSVAFLGEIFPLRLHHMISCTLLRPTYNFDKLYPGNLESSWKKNMQETIRTNVIMGTRFCWTPQITIEVKSWLDWSGDEATWVSNDRLSTRNGCTSNTRCTNQHQMKLLTIINRSSLSPCYFETSKMVLLTWRWFDVVGIYLVSFFFL